MWKHNKYIILDQNHHYRIIIIILLHIFVIHLIYNVIYYLIVFIAFV